MELIIEAAAGILLAAVVLVGILYFVCLFVVFPFRAWRYGTDQDWIKTWWP